MALAAEAIEVLRKMPTAIAQAADDEGARAATVSDPVLLVHTAQSWGVIADHGQRSELVSRTCS